MRLMRDLLGVPLHYLYYLDDFNSYDGLNGEGFNYLARKYSHLLPATRAGVAWAAKNPDFDFASVAPYQNYPYTQPQIYHYLKRFHETLEQQITKHNYTHPATFDTPVEYLTRIEQLTLRVEYKDGLLHGMKGPIDTTNSYRLFGPTGQSMYVLLPNDMLLISPHGPAGILFHSSLAAGQPIACAGDVTVHNGQLKAFNRHAPHYQPTQTQLQNLITHFGNHNVDLTDVEITGL